MVIHSVAPVNSLLPQGEQPQRQYVPVAGGYLECLCCGDGSLVIQRVISTDPAVYLDKNCAPGQRLFKGGLPIR